MKNVGYAVVGTGYFGSELARIINNLGGARVVAVLDPENPDVIAKELDCDVETDLDALCSRQDVDAVIVATPNYSHKEPVMKAAKYKKHVFCEKPIALSYDDCSDMLKATSEAGIILMAGHVMNFMRGIRKVKALINEGRIGKLLYCHSCRNGWEEPQPSISWKKLRSKSGGHLYHHIHELDFIQFLMGPATAAYMVGGNVAHDSEVFGDEDDMLFITLEFGNNTYATLQYGSAFRWPDHFVKIQGTEGAILIDLQDVKVVLKTPEGVERFILHESKEEDDDRSRIYKGVEMDGAIAYGKPGKKPPLWLCSIMKNEMEYFHSILQGKKPDDEFKQLLDGTAARASIATADALSLSLKERRRVDLAEIRD
jgi:predicted dehydrogenase